MTLIDTDENFHSSSCQHALGTCWCKSIILLNNTVFLHWSVCLIIISCISASCPTFCLYFTSLYSSLVFVPEMVLYPFGKSVIQSQHFLFTWQSVCACVRAAEQIWIGGSELITTCHPLMCTLPTDGHTKTNTLLHMCTEMSHSYWTCRFVWT